MTAINRTAYPRLSTIGSGRELTEVFTPTSDEIAWAREGTHDDRHLLALLVLLKAYQRLGYFPSLDEVPELAVAHLRALVGVDAEARHTSERTAKLHRSFVRVKLGVLWQPAEVRKIAAAAIEEAAHTKNNPADLINVALEELVRARCELPSYPILDRLTAQIRTRVNGEVFAAVTGRMDAVGRSKLNRLLAVDPVGLRSEFDALKSPAKAARPSQFKHRVAYLRRLDAIGDTTAWLAGVPAQKIGHFAGEARALDAADMRKAGPEKQLVLIASLLHEQRTAVRDEVADMFCKTVAESTTAQWQMGCPPKAW